MTCRIVITLLLSVFFLYTCAPVSTVKKEKTEMMISVIPKPVKYSSLEGHFKFDQNIVIAVNDAGLAQNADYLADWMTKTMGIKAQMSDDQQKGNVVLSLGGEKIIEGEEAYKLTINPDRIEIEARNEKGVFYGIQTLRQIIPAEYQEKLVDNNPAQEIPCMIIDDSPRYAWRGMMLDVSRHFFPKSFVKEFIDYLAMYKLNTFHWHLVDDQGWRIEIKKYPKLTEIGAWRVDREDRHWNDRPSQEPGEKATYGGYYTQEDIKEIVAYAKSRYITIVPEIEMPGHTVAALSAYPQYSCSCGPFTVLPGGYWPVSDIYCAGNDSTFLFLQDILTEVMALFPGEYIHIGGDEAEKSNWKNCQKCQSRINEENLDDEHELQSYFIKRMESFIHERGRKLIGWDEILEGGLAPRATVMSWRGFEGGITAAQAGHQVVMSPTSHCYFDYYQGAEDYEPLAIGGYLPLSKVYQFEPTPKELSSDETHYILGGQANLWTEYIPDPRHAQYMIFPRITALAEAMWSQRDHKDWIDFSMRVEREMKRYEELDINYAKSSLRVGYDAAIDLDQKQFSVELSSELPQIEIRYTLDGTEPKVESSKYLDPIVVDKDITIKAAAFRNGSIVSPVLEKSLKIHKSTGSKVILTNPPAEKYSGGGEFGLTNSIRGSLNHADGRWHGFEGDNLEAVIDLGEQMSINRLTGSFLNNIKTWIFLPRKVVFSVSNDGENFETVAELDNELPENYPEKEIKEFTVEIPAKEVRYIRVFAENVSIVPEWHMGAGGKAWVFCDEIIVE